MSKTRFVFSIAVVALMVATPATGQIFNSPVLALPAGDADGATSIGAGWGRGLNDQSGKLNSFGAGVVRAMEKVSFGVFGAYAIDAGGADASEATFGGSVAYHVMNDDDSPATVSIQGGIGYIKFAETVLNFPIGVAISGSTEAGSMMVRPWVMPRVQFTRVGGTNSSTDTDFGASAGVGVFSEGGVGLSLSFDWLLVDDGTGSNTSNLGLGVVLVYQLP